MTGVLTERPPKHGDPMAQAVPGPSAQRGQELLPTRPWDAEDLNRQRVAKLLAAATVGDGVVVRDDTGVPTPGQTAVGVVRQSAGTRGTVGHGQLAVPCG
jgi:SRSO17 transposase